MSTKTTEELAVEAIRNLRIMQAGFASIAPVDSKSFGEIADLMSTLLDDHRIVEYMSRHPREAKIQGGPSDGDDARAWAVMAHATFSFREAVLVLIEKERGFSVSKH